MEKIYSAKLLAANIMALKVKAVERLVKFKKDDQGLGNGGDNGSGGGGDNGGGDKPGQN
jgi:hypothetical protein